MASILYLDTASAHTQVAIANEMGPVMELIHSIPNEQAKVLHHLIEDIFEKTKYNWEKIDAIAVDAGPGSYTGLRVGLGAAKGFCFALNKPLMLFNRLDLMLSSEESACVVLRARQGEGFLTVRKEGATLFPPQHVFYEHFNWNEVSGLPLYTDEELLLAQVAGAQKIESYVLNINHWNHSAQQQYLRGEFADIAYCEPFYLKEAFTTSAKKKI